MTRLQILAAMAQAIDAAQFHRYAAAEAALDAAVPLFADLIAEHGLGEALLILGGRDRRIDVFNAALRAIGGDDDFRTNPA